ncbi:MAG TPA: hypothetical protein ACFYEK_17965 [Candidatus Wunengus sp. YC60]|uniref:hypothetical protein n=1 Tax=Candidatus Wunengus sp. YC60 TaxID=3367697 RepID=UPI004028D4B9
MLSGSFDKLKTPGTIILSLTGSLLLFVWTYLEKVLPINTKQELPTLYLLQLGLSVILTLAALSAFIIVLVVLRYKEGKSINTVNTDVEHKRFLIAQWRKMVKEINRNHEVTNTPVANLLERHESYYSLRPHLSQKTVGEVAGVRTVIAGSTIGSPLKFILDDIDRLEKEWHLI